MKNNKINIDLLKDALKTAETTLNKIESDSSFKSRTKKKKITRALEKAYATLNLGEYTEKEIDKRTNEVWASLIEESNLLALSIFFFGILLSASIVFTTYQAYAFIRNTLNQPKYNKSLNGNKVPIVNVDFKDQNTITLYNSSTVKDSIGLQSLPHQFSIHNEASEFQNLNYIVNYYIYFTPINDPSSNLIDKEYIKYKYTYKDSKTGKYYESRVGTLNDLEVKSDGRMLFTNGTQYPDSITDFKVTFWVGLNPSSEEINKTYTFKFDVETDISEAS